MKITRAIDVGYGNTKFTTADADESFQCMMFPSIAPQPKNTMTLSGGVFAAGDHVEIEIESAKYVVGPDAEDAASGTTQRALDSEYSLTNVYLALIRGALYYMKVPRIDMLVLGLPLTTYETHRDKLRERMVGGHTIPNPALAKNPGAPKHMSVEVAHVRVLPQPVGAFFNYCVPRGLYDKMSTQRSLVLDVGHGTFDWFMAKGNTPIKARCGGINGGVSKVISSIADAMGIGPGRNNFAVMAVIDHSLRTGEAVEIRGKPYQIAKDFRATADNVIRQATAAMLDSVENMDDINNIILTGGGAGIFANEVQKAIPDRKIIQDETPIYSNVCGFQFAGEQWAADLES